jgi:hypothetical protein
MENGDDVMSIKIFETLNKRGYMNKYIYFAKLAKKFLKTEYPQISKVKKFSTVTQRRSNMCSLPDNSIYYIVPINYIQATKRDFDLYESIFFETEDLCLECREIINVETISYDFDKMQNDLFWAQCPSCNNFIIPKLGIKLGEDDFDDYNYHKVILYSPFYLKQNYSLALLREYELKLDLEAFRTKFSALFWNSVWFFSLMNLPYDFFFPYKKSKVFNICLTQDEYSIKCQDNFTINSDNLNQTKNKNFDEERRKNVLMEDFNIPSIFKKACITNLNEGVKYFEFSREGFSIICIQNDRKSNVSSRNSSKDDCVEYDSSFINPSNFIISSARNSITDSKLESRAALVATLSHLDVNRSKERNRSADLGYYKIKSPDDEVKMNIG